MIKFFRKIRYNLMETGKTGKYLKYAIGEIILVVIGILIALQINNWNENRKQIAEEKEVIASLKEELKNNINKLNYSLEQNSSITAQTKNLLASIKNNTISNFNQFEVVFSLSYHPLQLDMPVLEELLKSDTKLITYKKKIIQDLRQLNSAHISSKKDLYYVDEIYNLRAVEFTIKMGLIYNEETESKIITLSDLEQNGYNRDQFMSLISLVNDLRKAWKDSQRNLLSKSEQLLEKLFTKA